ncbi:hypothetical protein DMN91_007472 [Ooceraea biroi]|uniref:Sodium/potassium-transporting ATPase subunit beta-1 n=1 Tax=Ooceraea biroi TaxID=2015173 RepID=A0A3L8DM08_OOCBI|nr:hypothetical protein DMN91_007472 [Ooceraea biroi]
MDILHDEEYYRSRIPEPDLGPVQNFMRFVWNPDRKTVLGRTAQEWVLLVFFYTCFFSVLGSLFALQMWISIDYVSKLDRPYFLYSGLIPRSYFRSKIPLFRQLEISSPESLGVCGKPPYGYTYPTQPCVLIKFNKRFDWVPVHYNKSSQLPENMPHTLQESVRSSNKEHVGEIEYLPNPGFPVHYFPFAGQTDYLAPMVALRFKNVTPFRLLTVECSLWALNINENARNALDFQIILGES